MTIEAKNLEARLLASSVWRGQWERITASTTGGELVLHSTRAADDLSKDFPVAYRPAPDQPVCVTLVFSEQQVDEFNEGTTDALYIASNFLHWLGCEYPACYAFLQHANRSHKDTLVLPRFCYADGVAEEGAGQEVVEGSWKFCID